MATVKIRFSIEIDDSVFINHQIEYESPTEDRMDLLEKKLTLDTVNEMNRIKSLKTINALNWQKLSLRSS